MIQVGNYVHAHHFVHYNSKQSIDIDKHEQ